LNTQRRSTSFPAIFTQANSTTVYGSIFQNNMDDSSFNDVDKSLIKTITLPEQAYAGYQLDVLANSETVCKVSIKYFFITLGLSILCNSKYGH
jgi:hypothetical protein